jgi:hypothetical protein
MTYSGKGAAGTFLQSGGNTQDWVSNSIVKSNTSEWRNQFIPLQTGRITVISGVAKFSGAASNFILSMNTPGGAGGKFQNNYFLTKWAAHTNYSANGTSSATTAVNPAQDGWYMVGDIAYAPDKYVTFRLTTNFLSTSNIWSIECVVLGENPSGQFCEGRTILAWDNSVHPLSNMYLSEITGQGTPEYRLSAVQGPPA